MSSAEHGPREVFRLGPASAEEIRRLGPIEVTQAESPESRTKRPIAGGVHCERLFGRPDDWECSCGRLRGVENVGFICVRCDQPVVHLQSSRFGRIELVSPVVNPLFFRTLAAVLNFTRTALWQLGHAHFYAVIEPAASTHRIGALLGEGELHIERQLHGPTFRVETGADAVLLLLEKIDLPRLRDSLRERLRSWKARTGKIRRPLMRRLRRRLRIIENICTAAPDGANGFVRRMLLDCLPVVPPGMRMRPSEGGDAFDARLSAVYGEIILRNNRLRRLIELDAPSVIIVNEKRWIQLHVDALFDKTLLLRPVRLRHGILRQGLADRLRGPTRQRLLYRRVDYSASGTLVVDADLRPDTCGIPLEVATELFRPLILARLATGERERQLIELLRPRVRGGLDEFFRAALRLYRELLDGLGDLLVPLIEEIMSREHLLVSVHHGRPGPMVALRPVLARHPVITLHPEVMALLEARPGLLARLHLPLSNKAKAEAEELLGLHRLRTANRGEQRPLASQESTPHPVGMVAWFKSARAGRRARWDDRRERITRRAEQRRAHYGPGFFAGMLLDDPMRVLEQYARGGKGVPGDDFLARWMRGAIVPNEDALE